VAPEAANSLPKILKPAEILILEDRFLVGTFEGVLEVLEIQVEGRKAMPVSQYIHGLQQKEALYFEF
jgi:methionyl-tRNA formyltransferase